MIAVDDRQLVARFLEHVADLSQLEIADRVPGVTQNDASRWRRGAFQRLTAAKRRALNRFLTRGDRLPDVAVAERDALLRAAEELEREAAELRERAKRLRR